MILLFLKALLLSTHLVLMNLAAAGPMICVLLDGSFRRNKYVVSERVGKRLAQEVISASLLGATVGGVMVLLLCFTEADRFLSAVDVFWNRVWWGIWEFVFFLICTVLYLRWWLPTTRYGIWTHRALALLAATNLLYHFPPLFTIIAEHSTQMSRETVRATSAEFRQLMFSPHVVALTLHFGLASIAVSGIRVMQLGSKFLDDEENAHGSIRLGAATALIASVAQMFVGFWLTLSLPNGKAVLGGDLMATAGLVMSVLLSFSLLSKLGSLTLGAVDRRGIRQASHLMIAIIMFMSATLVLTHC